jgi:hypothetical protein
LFQADQALEKPEAELSSSLEGLFSSDDDVEVHAPRGPTFAENNVDSKVTFCLAQRIIKHI